MLGLYLKFLSQVFLLVLMHQFWFVDEAHAKLKNSTIMPIEGASAFPHQDKPEETATAIMEFLGV